MNFLELSKFNYADQFKCIEKLIEYIKFNDNDESVILQEAISLSQNIKKGKKTFIEELLHSYDLTQEEGVALLCLTEALLRVKDKSTANKLLEDKLHDKKWLQKLEGSSFFMKMTSVGLAVASKSLNFSNSKWFSKSLSRVSAPVIRTFIKQAIYHISNDFIIGYDIDDALKRSTKLSNKGYLFSYDILGESSRSSEQSDYYYNEYIKSIKAMGGLKERSNQIFAHNNLSVKLSALHPRVEFLKKESLKAELYPKLKNLINMCKDRNICIIFDAEEAFRADIYIQIMHDMLSDDQFKGFDGIGLVVQAYQKKTFYLIDALAKLAINLKRQIPVRLVKGAYWDVEIKHSQMNGCADYPVFTHKKFTDVSYLGCAKKLIKNIDCFYPQFATHNAQTVSSILHLCKQNSIASDAFEFQKLLGMGDALYASILSNFRVRIYAPLGKYENLLAYLMRRFIENGANTSFVNQIYSANDLEQINQSPIKRSIVLEDSDKQTVPLPQNIFRDRKNSIGFDLGFKSDITFIQKSLEQASNCKFNGYSIVDGKKISSGKATDIVSPNTNKKLGQNFKCKSTDIIKAIKAAQKGHADWANFELSGRKKSLLKLAELFEDAKFTLYYMLINEAGKSIDDAISEVREAIDFIRYYAVQADHLFNHSIRQQGYTGEHNMLTYHPRGVFVCISPWNFPFAIFTGQIIAAIATGNSVIAKPASNTTAIATYAVKLMHKAGIPKNALNLLIASGRDISSKLLTSPVIAGVCFTGSTDTAWSINQILAARKAPIASFIAETGGQNCMIVDSTALLEQVTDDVVRSAFISQGQRCSALRVLYIQDEIYDELLSLIKGAAEQLQIGDTNDLQHDLGPMIDQSAVKEMANHVKAFNKKSSSTTHKLPTEGAYFSPKIIEISHISDLNEEKFGPILHVRRFKASKLNSIIDEVNSTGYGLTFGIHSRMESRYSQIAQKISAGNIYINRNTIGAVVETNPFGGEGLSGTGFKAGGPNYLLKFVSERTISENITAIGGNLDLM